MKRKVKRKTTLKTSKTAPSKRLWYSCIPEGSHGSTTIQKRLWKLTSDYVRIKEFYKYNGRCVSCRTILYSWQDGQACHWKRWSACNNYMKFYIDNLAFGCATCNNYGDQNTGYNFTVEMKRRHGENFADIIEAKNKLAHGGKLEDYVLEDMMKKLLSDFMLLEEVPDYVKKAYERSKE